MEMALPLARVSSRTLGATHVDNSAGELPLGWGLLNAWLLGAFWLRARWEPSLQGAFWEFSGSHLGARWQGSRLEAFWKSFRETFGKRFSRTSFGTLLGANYLAGGCLGPGQGPLEWQPPLRGQDVWAKTLRLRWGDSVASRCRSPT